MLFLNLSWHFSRGSGHEEPERRKGEHWFEFGSYGGQCAPKARSRPQAVATYYLMVLQSMHARDVFGCRHL